MSIVGSLLIVIAGGLSSLAILVGVFFFSHNMVMRGRMEVSDTRAA